MAQTPGTNRRAQLKKRFWPKDTEWNGTGSGWFKSPRTLPLILALLSRRELTSGRDVSRVYLELLARHMDEELGFIKSKQVGNQRYKLVLLVDPLNAVAELRKKDRVPESWWEAYLLRLMETKEADEERVEQVVASVGSDAQAKRVAEASKRSHARAVTL